MYRVRAVQVLRSHAFLAGCRRRLAQRSRELRSSPSIQTGSGVEAKLSWALATLILPAAPLNNSALEQARWPRPGGFVKRPGHIHEIRFLSEELVWGLSSMAWRYRMLHATPPGPLSNLTGLTRGPVMSFAMCR
jgi:hypothetical protein